MTKFTTLTLAIAALLAVPAIAQTIGAPVEEAIVLTEEPAALAQKLAEFADLERKHGERMQELFAQDPADALKAFRAICDEELALLEPLLASAQAIYAEIAAGIGNAPASATPDNASQHQLRDNARMANLLGVKLSSSSKRALAMQLKQRGSRKASWSRNADFALTTVHACRLKIDELKALRSLSSIYQVQATLNSLDHKLDESPIVKAFDAWAEQVDTDAEVSFDDPIELDGDIDLQDLGARDFRQSNY